MAVVRYPKEVISYLGNNALELLSDIGFPSEANEDEVEIEITPNRPDMLSLSYIKYQLDVFRGRDSYKPLTLKPSNIEIVNKKPSDRPYIAAFVAKGVKDRYMLFYDLIQFQEKIHDTFGRKRKKVAIGVHDLSKVEGNLVYEEGEDSFVPLGEEKEMTPKEVLENTEKGRLYGHLVKKYPLLKDEKGVISFPPILNSERTKVVDNTSDFFVDITGTNKHAVEFTALLFAYAFYLRGATIEAVKVDGVYTPIVKEISFIKEEIREDVKKIAGFDIDFHLLSRMGWYVDERIVKPPVFREDVKGVQDVVEDLLIVYGYNNVKPSLDFIYSTGSFNLSKWGEIASSLGFYEVYGWFLGNREFYRQFCYDVKEIVNPLTEEINALRPSLLPSLIEVEIENKMKPLPHLFFEEGRVFDKSEREEKAFLIVDKVLDINKGLSLLKSLELFLNESFSLTESYDWNVRKEIFIDGRYATFKGKRWRALVGEINPEVNERFSIPNPMVALLLRE